MRFCIFFFNDTATTEIYTLSLHDALPICSGSIETMPLMWKPPRTTGTSAARNCRRSEEHTSELQSRLHLVCRLLLEKKKISRNHLSSADSPEDSFTTHAAISTSAHSIPDF